MHLFGIALKNRFNVGLGFIQKLPLGGSARPWYSNFFSKKVGSKNMFKSKPPQRGFVVDSFGPAFSKSGDKEDEVPSSNLGGGFPITFDLYSSKGQK